jgi:asparagine synthase (glutamine-hydrolysing)
VMTMCGIWGYLKRPGGTALPRQTAEACVRSLSHRGPDGHSLLWLPTAAIGHTRLAIVDPTPAAAQPMLSSDGRFVLSFNGEIFNHDDLRVELVRLGHIFSGASDTEVLLEAYLQWGPDCLSRLRGMFAIGVVDLWNETIWLARDRLGIKPLYYLDQPDHFAFCSEPKGLLPLFDGGPTLDVEAVSAYLSLRHVSAPRTLFEGIRQLEAGTALTWQDGRGMSTRWWALPDGSRPLGTRRGRARALRSLVAEAVADELPPHIAVGCYLSGGIDSSILASELWRAGRPVRLLTAAYVERGYSETEHARRVADEVGLPLEVVPVDPTLSVAELMNLTSLMDQPLALHNHVALAQLARVVSAGGTRVVLSGEGADELFSGYGRISRLPFERLKQRYQTVLRWCLSRSRWVRPQGNPGKQDQHRGWRRHVSDPALRLLLEQYSYLPLDDKHLLLHPRVRTVLADDQVLLATLSRTWAQAESLRLHARLRSFLLRVHLPGLLQALDATGMAFGVETRFPYLDHRLVEWAVRLPASATLRWRGPRHAVAALREPPAIYSERRDITKAVLRDAFRGRLPASVLERLKWGFPSPLGLALGEPAGAELRDFVLGSDARILELFDPDALSRWWRAGMASRTESFGRQAWIIAALEAWLRVFMPSGPLLPADASPVPAAPPRTGTLLAEEP